ncbi:MAG: hypothetical protein ACR2G6_12015 [Gemmatimonadaceae bacterium]
MNRTLATAGILVLAACSDATNPGNSSPLLETLDVATVAGDAAAEYVSLMRTQAGAFGGLTSDATRTGAWRQDCTYSSITGRFACPDNTRGGITLSRSFALLDAQGQPQSAFDAITTASANFVTTISGVVVRENFSATFSRERNITVSGLAGNESTHVINGIGATSNTRSRHSDDGPERSYAMTETTSIVNVVVPFPHASGAWPISGTITRQISISRDGEQGGPRIRSRTAMVTFNGTQFVPIVVGDRSLTLDLATGKIVRN